MIEQECERMSVMEDQTGKIVLDQMLITIDGVDYTIRVTTQANLDEIRRQNTLRDPLLQYEENALVLDDIDLNNPEVVCQKLAEKTLDELEPYLVKQVDLEDFDPNKPINPILENLLD